jgi:hypothetical protein
MPTTTRADKPLEELSNRDLKRRARSAARTIQKLDSLDAAVVVREGRTDETLQKMASALETSEQVEAELQRRARAQDEFDREQAPFRVERWERGESKRKKAARVEAVLGGVVRFGHAELAGETLAGNRLSDKELEELDELVRIKRALSRGVPDAEELTTAETRTYERLVGKAAGDPQLFERKRRDGAAKAKLGELKEERRVASLPKRPVYAEPGSIELPRYVFQWLLAESNRDGANWGVSEIGLLATILLSFENRQSVIQNGQFVEHDGELTLVAPWGTGSEIKLVNRVQGSVHDGNGGVKVRASLATLTRNGWLEVEQSVDEIRIRLGERAKKLRSPEQRKEG